MKIFFRNKGEIQMFSDEGKLIEFINNSLALKKLLIEVLKTERKLYQKKIWSIMNEGGAI